MHDKGFTLVELMVTIAVVAIAATIALPSFQGTLRNNRAATATNELIASLSLARSEAIRTAFGSRVCPSEDGQSCLDDQDWSSGWLVARTTQGSGDEDEDEDDRIDVIRYTQPGSGIEVLGPADGLTFDGRGAAAAAVDLSVQPSVCGDQPLRRALVVRLSGQIARGENQACE